MMGRIRRCDDRCHSAIHPKCDCWCAGFFHGPSGAANREKFEKAWQEALAEELEREGQPSLFSKRVVPSK